MVANLEEDDCFGDSEARVHPTGNKSTIRDHGGSSSASGSGDCGEDPVLQSQEKDRNTGLARLLGVRWPGTALVLPAFAFGIHFTKAVPGHRTPRRCTFQWDVQSFEL